MQKRIKFDQILKEKSKIYPEIWSNLLSCINQRSPIFYIESFGSIAFIDGYLYLLLMDTLLKNHSEIDPMVNLEQYFLKPDCYRLNFRILSKNERHVVDYFVSYVKQLINVNHDIYLHVIDFQKLGKLILSKSIIEYFNGSHHWKYQTIKKIIRLPSLLQSKFQSLKNQQRLSSKLSFSAKKFISNSLKRQKRTPQKKLKRPSSAIKLNSTFNKNLSTSQKQSLDNNRVVTQTYQKRAKSKSKKQLDQLAVYKKQRLQIKTSIGKELKTEPNKEDYHRLTSQQKKKQVSRERRGTSRPRIDAIKTEGNERKVNFQVRSQKQKLTISDKPKLRLPEQRKKLTINKNQNGNDRLMTMEFVSRSSLGVLSHSFFKEVQKQKIQSFLQQISEIYIESQPKVQKNRSQKRKLAIEQSKILKKIKITQQFDHPKFQQAIHITQQEYNLINFEYLVIEDWKKKYRVKMQEYIVDFQQHSKMIQELINRLDKHIKGQKLSHRTCGRLALLLHQLFHHILESQFTLLDSIIKKGKKLIYITILKENSFEEDVMNFVETFEHITQPLISYIKLKFSKALWIQPHQIQSLTIVKSSLHIFIAGYSSQAFQNFSKFRTATCKTILNATYHTEKQGLALINKLDQLKHNLQNEVGFKSQLIFDGIFINLALIKQQFLALIRQKYYDINAYFLKVYEKSQNQLNNKLKTIIVINVDYLSDYKCRQYRQEIQEHYKNLLESLMLLINHFYYLFKQSEINHFLNVTYQFKAQIQHNLNNFYNKLQEYRNNSNKTIKMLQIQNKNNKEIYQDLSQKLKKLLINLVNQRSILQAKNQILKLDSDFEIYNANNKKLIQSMKDNEMVYWEDDQFFMTNINLLKSSLQFLQGKNFKLFFNTSIGDLTINQFYFSFQEFTKFVDLLADTKMDKLFKPTYSLLQNNLVLSQILLYKEYTQFQLQKAKELGVDIASEKNSKIFTTLKRYQNFDKKKFEKVTQIYRNSRLNEFNLYHDEGYNCLRLQKSKGQMEIEQIKNLNQIRQYLQARNSIKAFNLLQKLQQFVKLRQEVVIFNKMIYLISESALPDNQKQSILQEYNQQYEKLLLLNTELSDIDKYRNRLFQEKIKYMQIFYHQKVNVFARYALCSIEQLIHLQQWRNNENVIRNIKYIFQNVDDAIFDKEGNILKYVIGKDTLAFDRPFNIFQKQGQTAKNIFIHSQNFLRNSLNHSEFACVYIKILIWQIYFTQQVELSFMTESPVSKVKDYFLQIIKEIANQIRYDIVLHHKSYEIAQLNFFISHLDKIQNMCSITDFQWVSTIRYYQKLKIVKVQQNQRVHDYSFQIKKPLNYDPSFQLQTNISYGFKESSLYYEMSAYILGKPYATFQALKHYGFQVNYTVLMNMIKKHQFFIRVIVKPENFTSINYFHKKILQFSLKKMGSVEQQALSMPILFQYQSQSALPLCFTQKYRNFSNPEFSFDLNLIILLQLNKYQQVIEKSKINIDILIKVLNLINIKKSLTMKKAIHFIESLCRYLQEKPQKQQIYKFCYKYFIVNYQVEDQELSVILKELTKEVDLSIQAITAQRIQLIEEFLKKDKTQLIIYGPSSQKSFCLKQFKIPSFYTYDSSSASKVYFIEGVEQFLECKKELSKQSKIKLIIQDRYLYHIEPSLIVDSVLHYSSKLSASNIQTIFKTKLQGLKIEGSYQRLWQKFLNFYNIFGEIIKQSSMIGMCQLIIRCFQNHVKDFLKQLEPEEREYYKLTINKETIRTFMVVAHQIFYYMLSLQQRKKFSQKIRALPYMQQYRSQQLQTLTCKGFNCQKLLNLIKKEKVTFKNIGNYTKQFILIKKYLKYQQPIAIYSKSKITSKLLKYQIDNLQYNKINITLHQKFVDILRVSKYKNILYVINDLHLENKPKLTFLKARQEMKVQGNVSYYLMLTADHQFKKTMKDCIGFKYSDIEVQQVYKFQTKEGIVDQTQINCKSIWNNHFFQNEATFLMFLINISVKLPSQYYKKYFARNMVFTKLTPNALAIDTISESEELVRKLVDMSSSNAYLIDFKGHHQEITQTQVQKKIDKIMNTFSFVQKIIVKQYYKELIAYALSDRIYIIKEEIIIFPLIITNIHERKHFVLKNLNFIPELIEVIQQIYLNQKQCTLIIQEPLTSSSEWRQFLAKYLKGVDLINLYSELREYTELLAEKEQYVYRLDDQSIPLKDKVNNIIYSKIKIIISQTIKSTSCIPEEQMYINNIIYLNCSLTTKHKKQIAESILTKMMAQQSSEINDVLIKFKPFALELVDFNLIFLNRIQLFFNEIIKTIQMQLEDLVKFKEGMLQKRKLFYNLSLIREGIDRQFAQTTLKQEENKAFLNQILHVVNEFQNQPIENQYSHYQDLTNLRDSFTTNQQRNHIWIQQSLDFLAICQSLQPLFKECMRIENGIPILNVSPSFFKEVLSSQSLKTNLQQICERFSTNIQSSTFILLRYVNYILKLSNIYEKIESSQLLIQNQVKQLNYYYLLDVCIELKAKQTVILKQFDDLGHRKKLVQYFIKILVAVEHIDLEQNDLINYHIFNRIKRIIRSYAIESGDYPLINILSDYDAAFLSTSSNFEQYLLKENQSSFQHFNKSMLLQKLKLIIYDPNNKIQKLCRELSIKIIYVNSEHDIEELYDYKFKMTIFCIKLKTIENYYNSRTLIENCINIITKKHTDLKENILQKLVISIDEKQILSQIKQQFQIVNLAYNFIKFTQELERRMLNTKWKWSSKKQDYIDIKKKLRKEIDLIKTLNPEQISLYIIKLETIINVFQERHKQISQISNRKIFKSSDYQLLVNIFKLMIHLHSKFLFPMNLSLRLLKKVKIQDLLLKWQANSNLSSKEQEDLLKSILLSNRPDNLTEEIEECIYQSRYIAVIYEQFNKKIVKEVLQIEDTKKYVIRTIIEINAQELQEFENSTSFVLEDNEPKEVIIFFVKFHQIEKISPILSKCSVLWI